MFQWTLAPRLLARALSSFHHKGFVRSLTAATIAALCGAMPASAQTYPARTITVLVPGAPGGATDAFGRALAHSMTRSMGQTVIVENKPGASGMLSAQAVAQAAPDGYTILLTHAAPIQNAPHMGKTPYNVRKDFAFIAEIGSAPLVLAVNKNVPVKDMKEFLAWAQQNKGKLSYGTYGAGSSGHLMSAFLNQSRKLEMTHAAYKGEAQLIQDMIGGHVPWGIASLGSFAPHLAGGHLRALAITGDSRSKDLPDVPTMAEAGLTEPEFKPIGWVGVMAPAATPAPVLAELEKHTLASLQTPEMKQLFKTYAMEVTGRPSAQFRREFETTDPMVAKLIEISGAKQE